MICRKTTAAPIITSTERTSAAAQNFPHRLRDEIRSISCDQLRNAVLPPSDNRVSRVPPLRQVGALVLHDFLLWGRGRSGGTTIGLRHLGATERGSPPSPVTPGLRKEKLSSSFVREMVALEESSWGVPIRSLMIDDGGPAHEKTSISSKRQNRNKTQ